MGLIERFDTGDVPPSQRTRYWNEVSERRYSGSTVELGDENFAGEMWSWSVDQLALLRPRTRACRVLREPDPGPSERIILHLQCRGSGHFRQDGRSAILRPGDFLLFSTGRRYSIDLSDHETLAVECPRQPLDDRIPSLEDKFVQRIDGASPSVRMFHDFLLSLWHQGGRNSFPPEWEKEVGSLYYDMLALALRGTDRANECERTYTSEPARRVRALVEAMLQDPSLNSARLASESNLSVRSIQTIFGKLGTTPNAYILEQRLIRAAERLRSKPDLPITELAFDLGFNDSAYFSRCFRRRFGMPPREWRLNG